MQLGTKIGIGIGGAAIVAGGIAAAARAARDDAPEPTRRSLTPGATSPGDDARGTSPGDDPLSSRMPVRGHVDPPGWLDDYGFDGSLRGSRLQVEMDPRGWNNDIRLTGRVDHHGWQTKVDPAGWRNDTAVQGTRTAGGFRGTVDRPGLWNDVDHVVSETRRGAQVLRDGRFDEPLVPSFSEAVWRSAPNGYGVGGRTLEFDPPGWANTTRVTIESDVPAGVEATIAAALYDRWATEQERRDDYPAPGYPSAPGYPGGTAPGDDHRVPTSPGDDPAYPSYPTSPGDDGGGVYDPYPPIDDYPMLDELPPFS